jgi:hypothetical protein
MKVTITDMRRIVGELLVEAKRAKKGDKKESVSRAADALPQGYAYVESLDFSQPLGADNLYHLQGQAGWGPQTWGGRGVVVDDNIVLNKDIFRFKEGTDRSAWEILGEAVRPKQTVNEDSAWYMIEKHMGFKSLSSHLARQKNVRDPDALAADIGRKKLGAKKMAQKAAAGKK